LKNGDKAAVFLDQDGTVTGTAGGYVAANVPRPPVGEQGAPTAPLAELASSTGDRYYLTLGLPVLRVVPTTALCSLAATRCATFRLVT